LPKKGTKETVLAMNSSGDWTGPPDYVRLKVPFEFNDTHTVKYYHYAFASHLGQEEPSELELEEKVSLYTVHACGIFVLEFSVSIISQIGLLPLQVACVMEC